MTGVSSPLDVTPQKLDTSALSETTQEMAGTIEKQGERHSIL